MVLVSFPSLKQKFPAGETLFSQLEVCQNAHLFFYAQRGYVKTKMIIPKSYRL